MALSVTGSSPQLSILTSPASYAPPDLPAAPQPQASGPDSYTVRKGDSLSSIAGKVYHRKDAWTVLYWANRGSVRWADIVGTGQVLKVPALPAKIPAPPTRLAPAPPPPPPAPAAAPVQEAGAQPVQQSVAPSGYSGFQACVIARESGGNAQIMNSSGHYGLYQFSEATWVAYGGSAADFGHASVAEQDQVFASAMAQGGQSNWSPYDGC